MISIIIFLYLSGSYLCCVLLRSTHSVDKPTTFGHYVWGITAWPVLISVVFIMHIIDCFKKEKV
jgi:hypothetical protein